MPVVMMLKGKEKTYLFTDNCQYIEPAKIVKKAPRQYHIQRFKNFVIGYKGEAPIFQKFVNTFDLDSFPEPLTKSFLMRNFYMSFIGFLVNETDAKMDKGTLIESPFGIMILGKDYAFDIGEEYLYEVNHCNGMGDDGLPFEIDFNFNDKFTEEELIKLMMDKTAKYSFSVSYPFIMVTSDDLDTLKVIHEDGSITKEPLKELWRKNQ